MSAHKHPDALVYSSKQVVLSDLAYTSYTYPGDQEALAALKAIPGAGPLLAWLDANFSEQITHLSNNEQMVRINARNFGSLYALVERCCAILSCPVPDVYITTNPEMNAYTSGQRRTCIVLHSALVEALSPDELCFVIGHEIGHIKAAHGLYRQLGAMAINYWDVLASVVPIPGVGMLRIPLLLAYWEWYRRAEFSCDRAGLLCVQELAPGLSALAKLSGKVAGYEDERDIEETIVQTEASQEVNKLVLLVSILENSDNTHPFIPLRLKALKEFAQSDAYRQILAGQYDRASQAPTPAAESNGGAGAAGQAVLAAGSEAVDKWKNSAAGFFKR
ncbi:M48 family metallopeptidase [Azovibrio restrictus]|uniref:M48 family metallopeptidase n=1 Tax=Azovibrio restrictus TaxID=146938 RepID=UPI0026F2EC30|nr:M48 family metallopeptidase [Azovibrio restrictus]MDD3483771.1 M48 family metallopeptidase [Azovibrio restrictus]